MEFLRCSFYSLSFWRPLKFGVRGGSVAAKISSLASDRLHWKRHKDIRIPCNVFILSRLSSRHYIAVPSVNDKSQNTHFEIITLGGVPFWGWRVTMLSFACELVPSGNNTKEWKETISPNSALHLTLAEDRFPPSIITNTGLVLDENSAKKITTLQLSATDQDSEPAQLQYKLTKQPQLGHLEHAASPG